MTTRLTVLRTDGTREEINVCLAEEPGLYELKDAIEPLLCGFMDHVTVLHEGRRADMFVVEDCAGVLPRNEAATAIYRASWLSQHPSDNPESLPAIYGPAVLASRRVWF